MDDYNAMSNIENDEGSTLPDMAKRLVDWYLPRAKDLKGLSQSDIYRALKLDSAQVVSNWRKPGRDIPAKFHLELAELIGYSVEQMLEEAGMSRKAKSLILSKLPQEKLAVSPPIYAVVPIIAFGQIARRGDILQQHQAGHWDKGETFAVRDSKPSKDAFAVRVENDSMTAPLGAALSFPEGTVLVVDPDVEATSGRYVLAADPHTGAATFKKLTNDAGTWWLMPLNPLYKAQQVDGPGSVIGTVIEHWSGGKI
jgi:phage repressor protein C with HTH and peptisase S24 domain